MKSNRSVPVGVAVLLGVVAILSVLIPALHAPHSSAAGAAPPWEPDPNSAAPYGNLVFYDSSGNVVTSGSSLDHLFDYASGTTEADPGATKATMYFAAPAAGKATGDWYFVQTSGSTPFSGQTFPGSVATAASAGDPVVTLTATDADLNAQIGAFTLDSSAGYANIIQVRLKDTGPLGITSGDSYWSTDIAYNQGTSATTVDGVSVPAGGWAQIYPSATPATPTTTTITASAGSVSAGTAVTYTATVKPNPGGGTVAFNDGTGNLATTSCAAQAVDTTNGTATCVVTYTANGTYTVNASYTPDPTSTFAGSATTTPASVVVTGGTTKTPTTITLSPTTPGTTGSPVTYTATVSPAPDGGTVAFDDANGNQAKNSCATQPVDAQSGTSTCTVTYTAADAFAVNATYSGDASFATSTTSTPQTQTITKAGPAKTSTTVTSDTTPSSLVGQQVTYTATVTATGSGAGTPTGTVTFNDGPTAICTGVALSPTATATCQQTPSTAATHSITAVYTNTDGNFAGSSSSALSQVVDPAQTSVAVTSSQNPASVGVMVTLTATVSVTAPGSGSPTGTVDFADGTGNPASSCTGVAVSDGTATCSVTYNAAVSDDQVSATYKNADGDFVGSSTSSPLDQVVQAAASLPGAPGGVQATAGDSEVALTWTAPTTNSSSVTGYDVFEGTSAGGEGSTPVNTSPITGTTYTATGLTNGTTYYFTVEAVSAAGSSPASTEVSATPASSNDTTTTSTTAATSTNPGSQGSTGESSSQDSTDPAGTASAAQTGSLPFTGIQTTATVAAGLLMLAAGIFLVGVARNRKKVHGDL